MEQTRDNLFDLQFDHQSSTYIMEIAKWSKFQSIVWFVLCAVMGIGSIIAGAVVASEINKLPGGFGSTSGIGGIGGVMVAVIYLFGTALQLIPNIYRYKFSMKAIAAIRNNDQLMLNDAWKHLRTYTKYWGILTIIGLAFMVLMAFFAIIGYMVV